MRMSHKIKLIIFIPLVVLFISSACALASSLPGAQVTTTPMPTPSLVAVATEAPQPTTLTVCLGQEPNTLYPFGGPNLAARSVLAAIYDGPIDRVNYRYQPVILTQIPSMDNGDAQVIKKSVKVGDKILDASGSLVLLAAGTRLRPAECRADDCAIAYDGTSEIEMDQLMVNFHMRTGLTWSDGTLVTADDSVFAYELAKDPSSVSDTFLIDRTVTYEAADDSTVQWWGVPGFIDATYFTNFWQPAPRHAWAQFPIDQLLKVDVSVRTPAGWGPYMVQEWLPGDHIKLIKNPHYFRLAQGFPKFDNLVFRFISNPDSALSELVAGRCDILDPSIRLDSHISLLKEMEKSEQAQVFMVQGMTIEWLGIGTNPAVYDDGYDPVKQRDRQDIFSDAHTRQGFAYCLDREKIVTDVLLGNTTVPVSFLPVGHPLFDPNLRAISFDPSMGQSLLEQAGWKDTDGDPNTPRQAVTVQNVTPGTPLVVNYYTTTATQRRQAADILMQSLSQCGIGVNVQFFSQNDLYSAGPEGLLFGRRFDLIQYAMGVDGIEPPCDWFTSAEIPSAGNHWIGTNVTGYKNEQYDAACHLAQLSLPDEQSYADSYRQTQSIFSSDLPAIPLYYRLRVAAARAGICNLNFDATANPMWNIEAVEAASTCQN